MVTPPSCTFVEAALLCLWASSNDWKCRMEQNSSWISKFTERWRISRAWEFPNEFPKTFLSIRFSVGISGKFFYLTQPLCNWWLQEKHTLLYFSRLPFVLQPKKCHFFKDASCCNKVAYQKYIFSMRYVQLKKRELSLLWLWPKRDSAKWVIL